MDPHKLGNFIVTFQIDKLQRQHGTPAASVHFEEVHYLDVDELEPTVITPVSNNHALHHRRATDSGIDTSAFVFLESPPMQREYYDIRPTLPDLRPFNLLDTYTLIKHRKSAGGFRLELRKLLVNVTRMLHSSEARGQYTMLKPGVRREAKKKQYPGALVEHIVGKGNLKYCYSSIHRNSA
ncbi:hypothetical protein OESDEN_01424 [Oesophagostomum dentatum]|uniref:Uncharacterized protein n=1 Tax=Oesophagostomum dentatum TaxID=61180 RepID=A0A0B1TM23_OESDE|nr:hypothetical protein OESDEN_01424 [Oesophagostomum dentatum]